MTDPTDTLFDQVPGPSPWYLTPTTKTVKGFQWKPAGQVSPAAGKTLLLGCNGPVAVLNFYNYTMMLDESSLLLWHQQWTHNVPTEPVRLLVIDPNRLSSLPDDLDSLYKTMNDDHVPIALGGLPTAEVRLPTDNCSDELRAEFPEQTRSLEELLILCRSSSIPTGVPENGSNSALLVARPRESSYRIYPQDWFNSGGLDYGYQWITRIARNPLTGKVQGEGIRISPFVLDNSLRKLCK